MEPSKFLKVFYMSRPKKPPLKLQLWNFEFPQKTAPHPVVPFFPLLVLDCSTLAHGVIQDFFTDSERLGSYLQKLVCVDEVQCLLQA